MLFGLESGRSCSNSFLDGLGGALDSRSSSPSPTMSGEELLLVLSSLSEDSGGPLPLSRFLCSSLRRSALRHFALEKRRLPEELEMRGEFLLTLLKWSFTFCSGTRPDKNYKKRGEERDTELTLNEIVNFPMNLT